MTDASGFSARPPRMLIAADDPLIVKLLADRCAGVGFEIETATNGIQALIKANRSHPDVMVIDVNVRDLGEITGQSLMREVRGKPGVARI